MKKAFGIVLTATVLLWTAGMVTAGSLNPTLAPDAPGYVPMPTLKAIYDEVVAKCGCEGAVGGGDVPTATPEPTMYTLQQIYDLINTCCSVAAGAIVPKTGQTATYVTYDDGHLQRGMAWPNPRFTDHGNGTVTDNLTGLMWTKNANVAAGTKTFSEAPGVCEACTDGSYTDWHLPNLAELQSLLYYGAYNPAIPNTAGTGKWTSGDPFLNVQAQYYWSSTTYSQTTANAFRVHTYYGITEQIAKTYASYVWCVRGTPSE